MIILAHHTGEPYGLLGPQVAATYISRKVGLPTSVLGVLHRFDKDRLLEFLKEHYRDQDPVIAFSHHCGRPDLFTLMGELKELGFRILLAGPQAVRDYEGEPDRERSPLRFRGLSDRVDLAWGGPVDGIDLEALSKERGHVVRRWHKGIYLEVDWDNLLFFSDGLQRPQLEVAQVLRGIGCPYAAKAMTVTVDPPSSLPAAPQLEIETRGCTFCDVAWDKGFSGTVDDEGVLAQVEGLPERGGVKIPFELIDEYPLAHLEPLLDSISVRGIKISQVNLVLRPDDILHHREALSRILKGMKARGQRLLMASIGFESFSERILRNLNKGVTVEENLEAIRILRGLKEEFPETLLYRRDEGAVHGFIHPTPWDDRDTEEELNRIIGAYQLFEDILPAHSTPLIIHHGSPLAQWIRKLEDTAGVRFRRTWTWIEWWKPLSA